MGGGSHNKQQQTLEKRSLLRELYGAIFMAGKGEKSKLNNSEDAFREI